MSYNYKSDHLKLACEFFKEISYMTPSIFSKANEFKIRLKYKLIPKANDLNIDSNTYVVPKYQQKYL